MQVSESSQVPAAAVESVPVEVLVLQPIRNGHATATTANEQLFYKKLGSRLRTRSNEEKKLCGAVHTRVGVHVQPDEIWRRRRVAADVHCGPSRSRKKVVDDLR